MTSPSHNHLKQITDLKSESGLLFKYEFPPANTKKFHSISWECFSAWWSLTTRKPTVSKFEIQTIERSSTKRWWRKHSFVLPSMVWIHR